MWGRVNYINGKPYSYEDYTIATFSDWRALQAFADYSLQSKPSQAVVTANNAFKTFVDSQLSSGNTMSYGLFGKHPRTYEEAIRRDKFVYFDEYKKIKERVEKKVRELVQKSKIVEIMKPTLVLNDKEIGEFIFERAAMALKPNLFLYSPSQKREIDTEKEKVITVGDKLYLEADNSLVVYALKVEKQNGEIVYIEAKGDESLIEAQKLGKVSYSSSNKKVYLYKEKKPRPFNAVKIIVGLSAGGFTQWINDFYTGVAATICVDVLESMGYSCHVEIVVGGGRCRGCQKKLYFNGNRTHGRRFFTFTAKTFDDLLDFEGLAYTLCDPSFHNIKFISLLNNFFNFFGDELDSRPNPSSTWHGVEKPDMINPVGMYHKMLDDKAGRKDVMHFFLHKIGVQTSSQADFIRGGEQKVIEEISALVIDCENQNYEALKKFQNYDFGDKN